MTWDPDQYHLFSDERSLPFRHLLAAVQHIEPGSVVDLGCGSGALTTTLIERWPSARVTGIDTSPEMISHAKRREIPGRLVFERADATTWRARQPVDLFLSNACFHWIDDHTSLVDHLLPQLAEEGTLAFQVPANHDAPSHTILRDLCSSERWRDQLDGHPRTGVRTPEWYQEFLESRNLKAILWRTTYHHVLEGENSVLEWVRGTTLRPILGLLPENEHTRFLTEYGLQLAQAYPRDGSSTTFPFTRIFAVAQLEARETRSEEICREERRIPT